MKCPNCDFVDTDEAFGKPATCPSCGAIYEKALRVRAIKNEQEQLRKEKAEKSAAKTARAEAMAAKREAAKAKAESVRKQSESKISKALDGAAAGMAEAREARRQQEAGSVLYTADGRPVMVQQESRGGCLRVVMAGIGLTVMALVASVAIDSYKGYRERSLDPEAAAELVRSRAEEEAKRKESDLEFNRQYHAKKMVKEVLMDPYTAKFRNQKGMCGEVNSKNAYGAYTGYKRFMVGTIGVFFEDDSVFAEGAFDEAWEQVCAQ